VKLQQGPQPVRAAKLAQVTKPAKAEKRKKRKYKRRQSPLQDQRPLPPPIPTQPAQSDPFKIAGMFPEGEAGSGPSFVTSSTEPKPGQPLSPEAESILAGIDAGSSESAKPAASGSSGAVDIAGVIPQIQFKTKTVEKVLREGFEWLANKFGSDHWLLTDNQAEMLGEPTAELLSSLFSKLPDFLTRWCDTTPGLAGLVVAGVVVIGPKVAAQVALVRVEKNSQFTPAPSRKSGPQPVRSAPVGDAMSIPVGDATDDHPFNHAF
jgi:hypothetical protein